MLIYLIGVIATIALMILGYYIIKENIYSNDMFFIIFISIFSWVGITAVIITLLVTFIMYLSENFKSKPIIKWKSQEKK